MNQILFTMKRFSLLFTLIWVLTACTGLGPAPVTQTEAPTSQPTNTLAPTEAPTAVPATAVPTAAPTATLEPTAEPSYPPEGYGPKDFPQNVNPLTGLQVDDVSLLERRPVAVKINIVPRTYTRPPWGLSLADIVYDYYHNDGYSRFHAIYYGNDAEMIGPIRSARLLDDALVQMYKSLFAYGGADENINDRLFTADYSNRLVLERGQKTLCPPTPEHPLCREDPEGYDLLIAGTQAVHAAMQERGIDDSRQDLSGMSFNLTAPKGGEAADQVITRYSKDMYSLWAYDESSGLYVRSQDARYDDGGGEEFEPLVDQETEAPVTAANVVVVIAPHEYFRRPPAEIVEILMMGTGKAYAFRDGQVYEVRWNRPTASSVLYLTFPDGSAFDFKPGNTWFQVVGESTEILQPEDGLWRFNSRLP